MLMAPNKATKEELLDVARDVFNIEANAINKLSERLGLDFSCAIDILYNCKGRVIITGMGKSGLIGQKIAATFSSTGTPSYFLHPAESTHGDSGILTRDDVVIAISNSGETNELLNLLPIIQRFNIPMIAMTGKKESTLGKQGWVCLDISVEKEACPLGKAPTASTTATLAMGDALAMCLIRKRGFSVEDFLLYHPSGALGTGMLYKVEELMTTNLPIVNQDENFKTAISEISEKKLGSAIIVDNNSKMVGILTDGDIRRTLLSTTNVENLTTKDVMTKNPKTIEADDLAAKALQIMEQHEITSLVVTDETNTPQGLIHIHELLKAGVA